MERVFVNYPQALARPLSKDFRFPSLCFRPLIRFNTILMETNLKRKFLNFLSDESGATAIEYGLIAAGIAVAIIAAVNGTGSALTSMFNNVSTNLK
jgi:pilus assembly protein Flp/PilA